MQSMNSLIRYPINGPMCRALPVSPSSSLPLGSAPSDISNWMHSSLPEGEREYEKSIGEYD